jgi:hypothetical protein
MSAMSKGYAEVGVLATGGFSHGQVWVKRGGEHLNRWPCNLSRVAATRLWVRKVLV